MSTKVLVVDDQLATAEATAINLRVNGYQPVVAVTPAGANAELHGDQIDVVLLSASLSGASTLLLAEHWCTDEATAAIPVVLMAEREGQVIPFQRLSNCVEEHLTYPFSATVMIRVVRSVLKRTMQMQQSGRVRIGDLVLDATSYRVWYMGVEIAIRHTEFKLLSYFMRHPEQAHTRAQLVEHVWGKDVALTERIVDANVKRLRDVLGDASFMLETVRSIGYRLTLRPGPRAGRQTTSVAFPT